MFRKKNEKPLWTLFSKFSSEEDNLKMHFGLEVISKIFYIHLGLEMFDPELKIMGLAFSTQMFKPELKILRLTCTFVINFIFTSYVKFLSWSYRWNFNWICIYHIFRRIGILFRYLEYVYLSNMHFFHARLEFEFVLFLFFKAAFVCIKIYNAVLFLFVFMWFFFNI